MAVIVFTTTYEISAYHHWCCEFESRSSRGVQHYVIKFVSDLRQVGGFLRVLRFPPPIELTATIKLIYCWKWRETTSNKHTIYIGQHIFVLYDGWYEEKNKKCKTNVYWIKYLLKKVKTLLILLKNIVHFTGVKQL